MNEPNLPKVQCCLICGMEGEYEMYSYLIRNIDHEREERCRYCSACGKSTTYIKYLVETP